MNKLTARTVSAADILDPTLVAMLGANPNISLRLSRVELFTIDYDTLTHCDSRDLVVEAGRMEIIHRMPYRYCYRQITTCHIYGCCFGMLNNWVYV